MNPPTINDAKALAYKLRAPGVLVITIGGGQYGAASYGHTRRTCDAMRRVTDRIADLIQAGQIEIPDELVMEER